MKVSLNGRIDNGALDQSSVYEPIAEGVAIQEKCQQRIERIVRAPQAVVPPSKPFVLALPAKNAFTAGLSCRYCT